MKKPMQRGIVSIDPVVSIVSVELLPQLEMLLADRPVSIESTPLCYALHCTARPKRLEAVLRLMVHAPLRVFPQ